MYPFRNQPYSPDLYHLAGTYRVNCGETFYLGSTRCFGSRNSDHRNRLEKGEHPNKSLQAAYDASKSYSFTIIHEIAPKQNESAKDHTARLKFNEQILLNEHAGNPSLANTSESSTHNSTIGDWMKAKWQDPEFRAAQITRLKARRGSAVSEESRRKMSESKKGANNVNSRTCIIHFNGKSTRFESVRDAAIHHNVSQQAMDQWLKGIIPWPGTGQRKPKRSDLIGMTGKLLD